MKMKMVIGFLVLSFTITTQIAQAGIISYEASSSVSGFNTVGFWSTPGYDGPTSFGAPIIPVNRNVTYDGSTASSELSGNLTFAGVNVNNDPATMTLTYDTQAQVSSGGVLKASASASIDTPFFNTNQNSPFVIGTQGQMNENGVPESFNVHSQVAFRDEFTVVGGSELDYVQFELSFDGFFHGTGGYVQIDQFYPEFDVLFYSSFLAGDVNTTFTTSAVSVENGIASLGLFLGVGVDLYLAGSDGGELSGEANFFNTLTIEKISGFDAAGNAVDLKSVQDSSQVSFETTRVANSVPEPSTLILFAFGGLFLAKRRKAFNWTI